MVWPAWLDSLKAFALRFVRDFSEQLAARGRQGNPLLFCIAQIHNAEIGLRRYDRIPFKDVKSERQWGPVHPTRDKPGLRVGLNVGERQRIEALVAWLADESAAYGTAAHFAVTQLRALSGSLRAAKQCWAIDVCCFLSRPWQKPAACRRT